MVTTNPPPTSDDELDDILNGIAAEGGYVQSQPEHSKNQATNNNTDAALGIDEEIVVTKKRIPIPKLDDVRLRSEPGIPRLRKISKERLRFKGKGHEYGDIARMLNMYQLWLDDLYPRAKFADALAIIEKVGHTKRMQVDRKAWIDEGKPKHAAEHDEDNSDVTISNKTPTQSQEDTREGTKTSEETLQTHPNLETLGQSQQQSHPTAAEPDEDELDAILAESAQPDISIPQARSPWPVPAQEDPFADDMEAMEAMEDMW